MSRPTLRFLRPYLTRGFQSAAKPEVARAYSAIQRRFAHASTADAYTGRHDVEKQKRLDQLREMKPLDQYHPRLVHADSEEFLSLRDFVSKYESIQETAPELVSVFGEDAQLVEFLR